MACDKMCAITNCPHVQHVSNAGCGLPQSYTCFQIITFFNGISKKRLLLQQPSQGPHPAMGTS